MPRMGIPPSPWNDLSFASKGEVTCGTVTYANCLNASIHHIGTAVHVPMSQDIDAALAADPELDPLGPFADGDADVETIRVYKTI